MTLNKMCGSGMQAAILAHDMIVAGSADCVVAGGMESMTNAPYLLAKHRKGARFGHDSVKDSMLLDGLEDAYETGKPWAPSPRRRRAPIRSGGRRRTNMRCGHWNAREPRKRPARSTRDRAGGRW